jgi:hypothetical protein
MKNLLALLGAGLTVLATVGCNPSTSGKKDTGKDKVEAVVLEIDEIEIIPGEAKPVKVTKGKADSAEVKDEDSGVTAEVKDGAVHVKASKEAKPGTHEVTVKGKDGKTAKLKVKVAKKGKKKEEKED